MDHYTFLEALRLIHKRAKDHPSQRAQSDTPNNPATPHDAEGWHAHAIKCARAGDEAGALAACTHALTLPIRKLALVTDIDTVLRGLGHDPVTVLGTASASQPPASAVQVEANGSALPKALVAMALRGDWRSALPYLENDLADHPKSRRRADNLALAWIRLGDEARAQCVSATTLAEREDWLGAANAFLAVPLHVVLARDALTTMLIALHYTGKELHALEAANEAARLGLCDARARLQWASILMDLGRAPEAIEVLQTGAAELDDPCLGLQSGLIITPVPDSRETVASDDARVSAFVRTLATRPLPETPEALARLASAIEPNFYASYREQPNLPAIRHFAEFASRVINARYATCNAHMGLRPPAGRKLRIGYVTRQASNHTVARHFAGWLNHADGDQFETHLFPLTHKRDWMSLYLHGQVDVCHPATEDFATAVKAIREAELDLLVHIAIGMDPLTLQIGALRLAPVQCAVWGHPVSTGLPSIDFFISAGGMEPDDGHAHYSERLVTLPGTGVMIPETVLPKVTVTRTELGIPEASTVFVSAQSLFKYLPQYDDIYARIAREVDDVVFVFAEGEIPAWARTFRKRVEAPFHALGIAPEKHIHILPQRGLEEYFALLRCCDVMLDTVGWSGGQTSYDALAVDLPIVTLPGVMMRGRQTYGMLRKMGVEDTIATDVDDYVRIAVRLGKDADWRKDVTRRVRENSHKLFNDTAPVRALEAFYRFAVGAAKPGDTDLFKLWPPNPNLHP